MSPPISQHDAKKKWLRGLLEAAARDGKRCPTLPDLARTLGVSATTVKALIEELRDDGTISWRTVYCGTGLGNVRVVRITATGQETATPAKAMRASGTAPTAQRDAGDPIEHAIEAAKTVLRRAGKTVFEATVTDGDKGKGFIKVNGQLVKRHDIIAMAAGRRS